MEKPKLVIHFLGTRRFISDGFFAGICFPTDKGSLVLPEKKGRLKVLKDKILSFSKVAFVVIVKIALSHLLRT